MKLLILAGLSPLYEPFGYLPAMSVGHMENIEPISEGPQRCLNFGDVTVVNLLLLRVGASEVEGPPIEDKILNVDCGGRHGLGLLLQGDGLRIFIICKLQIFGAVS